MKIDNINMSDLYTIENNYDNIGVLKIVKYLLGVVVNDVDYMREYEEKDIYDLGNNYIIKNEDLESIVSIMDTIEEIRKYNGV